MNRFVVSLHVDTDKPWNSDDREAMLMALNDRLSKPIVVATAEKTITLTMSAKLGEALW